MLRTCLPSDTLRAFLAGQLVADEEADVARHVEGCPSCEGVLEQLSDDAPTRALWTHHRRTGCDEQPDSPELVELRERLHVLGWFSADVGPVSGSDAATCADSDDATQVGGLQGAAAAEARSAPTVGKFEIVQPIGAGGFGVVYLARDRVLDRLVALKLARSSVLADPGLKGRFLREAQALGRLQHPNIIPVFEAGEHDGTCYLAVAYCDGPTLEQWLRDQEYCVDPRLPAKIVLRLAEAVEHAHKNGILHRDIKPSNVLLDGVIGGLQSDGAEAQSAEGGLPFVPKLTDFGLAKIIEQPSETTITGVVLGTPQYMAPEQAAGLLERIGPPTDVYALGAVLYEMLTGRPPIRGATSIDTLRRVLIDEPPPPVRLTATVPDDLDAIVMKCLDKSPTRRYATAGELAADLERFLSNRPTLARPLGRGQRAVRWVRRNPAASAVSGLVLMVLALGGGLFLYDQRLSHLRHEVVRQQAESSYRDDVYSAAQRLGAGDVAQTVEFLKRQIPGPFQPDLRGLEWHYLWSLTVHDAFAQADARTDIYQVCLSPDGKQLVAACRDGNVRLYDARTLAEQAEFATGHGEVNGVALSSDGQLLATAGDDGKVRLWNWKGRKERIPPIAAHSGRAFGVAFFDGNRKLATCGIDPTIRLWDCESGKLSGTLAGHSQTVEAIAVAPAGDLLASAGDDEQAILWDLKTGREVLRLKGHSGKLTSICFSPDGKLVATGGQDCAVCLWDRDSGRRLGRAFHLDGVQCVTFSGDGKRLVAGDRGGTLRSYRLVPQEHPEPAIDLVLDTADDSWHGHEKRVWSLLPLPGGQHFVSAGQDGKLRAWGRGHATQRRWKPDADDYKSCEFTRDGSHFFALRQRGGIEEFDATGATSEFFLSEPGLQWDSLAILRGREQVAIGSQTGEVLVWNWRSNNRLHRWKVGDSAIQRLTYSPAAHLLAVISWAWEDVRLYEPNTGERVAILPAPSCTDCAISPDGRELVVDTLNNLAIYDLRSFRQIRLVGKHAGAINSLAYSPDGRLIASASSDRTVRLWTAGGQSICELGGHASPVNVVAFTSDGKSLVTGADDGHLKIFHVPTRRELIDIPTGTTSIRHVAIAPDNRQLAIVGHDYEIIMLGLSRRSAED